MDRAGSADMPGLLRHRTLSRTCVPACALLAMMVTPCPAQEHAEHSAAGGMSDPAAGQAAGFAMATYRTPRAAAHEMVHAQWGSWSVAAQTKLTVTHRWDPPPRGRRDVFQTSMGMISLGRPAGRGWLTLEAMVSAEPITGSERSLLLQTGETADGVQPLVDRQHPHDALMALGASYRMPLLGGISAFLYAARVGSPALGPTPFMHRSSAAADPMAPISHHFLDATHISHGVLTAGLRTDLVQLEVSVFNGREPDHDRWGLDPVRLDSRAVRVTFTPSTSWVVQASVGELEEPEQLHPGIDVQRTTLSVTHATRWGAADWSTTLAWGRNIRREAVVTIPPHLAVLPSFAYLEEAIRPSFHFGEAGEHSSIVGYPERSASAWLAETTVSAHGLTATARFERALKDELFGLTDPRHDRLYDVRKLELGLIGDVHLGRHVRAGLGGTISHHFLPPQLRSAYRDERRSYMVFARFALTTDATGEAASPVQ